MRRASILQACPHSQEIEMTMKEVKNEQLEHGAQAMPPDGPVVM
jgi:hypothetical protein